MIEKVVVDCVDIGRRLRKLNPEAIDAMAESMKRLGQLQPITVHTPDDGKTVVLVAGEHRLEAAKRLGWDMIDCVFITGDEVDRELHEIAENLHRAELTALERSTQIARWAELTAAKASQPETPLAGGSQPAEKGIRKVAADLGLDKSDVQRAVKVASMSDKAKRAAIDAGLDDNRSALLAVAKESTPEAQVAKVNAIAEHKAQPVPEAKAKISAEEDARARRLDRADTAERHYKPAWGEAEPFVTAIRQLLALQAKPLKRFVGMLPSDDLRRVGEFVLSVAAAPTISPATTEKVRIADEALVWKESVSAANIFSKGKGAEHPDYTAKLPDGRSYTLTAGVDAFGRGFMGYTVSYRGPDLERVELGDNLGPKAAKSLAEAHHRKHVKATAPVGGGA